MVSGYEAFIESKSQGVENAGFDPLWIPDFLFDFQKSICEWAIRKGRAAIFADCGLGKTPMQLVWAENVCRKTEGRVLILTPLAVANQTCREGAKFGIDATLSRDGSVHRLTVTNYEILHKYNPEDFAGVVCDESSILKSFSGETKKRVIRFLLKVRYRLLCTATAAPNDYVELGNSSEALGCLSHSDMLKMFFRQLDDKGQKKEEKQQVEAERGIEKDGQYYGKLAFRVAQTIGQWRLKNHAVQAFWRWVTSWARACRKPSDLGFSDHRFILPKLTENQHIIEIKTPPPNALFYVPAFGLGAEREERNITINERCEYAKRLVSHDRQAIIWCHGNAEGDLLESLIPDSRQIAGKTPDETKIELYEKFSSGALRVLIIKPKIGAWGLNWQNCNHVVTFASHSYEQYYQSIRRCWRFGQTNPVTVDVISTEGEARVVANLQRKSRSADIMFDNLVREMNSAVAVNRENRRVNSMEVPSWL